ncbi:DNA polymerase III subunit delta' [Paramaledivibacter caminithermalis]|uniref:DNA polymerase III subunit delta' n=1 Tax=Paramaledivibacter caminithermalis (strain DSM 15212 / CIP 107654 / DViRD3) TaxID=1121301 RepID=A0A1M6QAZ6_PARC5|nr:DNA polymerase III subunit delta' [Paramaledivibacter caminithermalis]SHK17267.1 DNA polymerase-3 subunit delta' [Paramaledivibacter caminithermalis DSM 15212]
MGFEKIIGHDRIINFLKTAIKGDKLAHAYIFEGQKGVGKTLTAVEFAKAINCKNDNLGCEECSSCVKINNNNHPDINIIQPDGNSIKNKQIEEFQNDILLKPYESNKKIFIIEDSHTMTISAQNRLLKILEEPPGYCIIILVAQNSNSLLPTIRSRSQTIKFNRISKILIEDYLKRNYNIKDENLLIFSGFSDGSIGKAINLYESEEFKNRRNTTLDIIDEVIRGDKLKLLDYVDFFIKNKDYIDEILDLFSIWFRDLLLLSQTREDKYLLNIDKIDILRIHMNRLSCKKLGRTIDIIEETKKNIDANLNFGLCIETMLLNLQEV